MYPHGFYRVNSRRLNFHELISFGWWRLPLTFVLTRFMPLRGGAWLPSQLADMECRKEELPDRFWEATERHRQIFHKLGFVDFAFLNGMAGGRNLDPMARAGCGTLMMHLNRAYFGKIYFAKIHQPTFGKDKERVIFSSTAAFSDKVLSYTNSAEVFDPGPDVKVTVIKSDDPNDIYRRFTEEVERQSEPAIVFRDSAAFRSWHDSQMLRLFEFWVQRGLFVRMSDEEVAEARRKLPPPLPKGAS